MTTTILTQPKAANGGAGANGSNGTDAIFTQNGKITADPLTVQYTGGEGGDGGAGGAAPGGNGGKGGNASITLNGNIFQTPTGSDLQVSLTATGGNGGLGGTGTPAGTQGNGGNGTVVANGNILQPNKAMNNVELDAIAVGGTGTKRGNASATLNGNIIQVSKGANTASLIASATVAGDATNHDGDLNWGTKTATINGNIIQGNVSGTVTVAADTWKNPGNTGVSNGTANINGNVVQLNTTSTATVNLEASGNHISVTNNKITVGTGPLDFTINSFSPYDTTIKDNAFKGQGSNAFVFTDNAAPGPHADTVSIDLGAGTFVFDGNSNTITGFNSITVAGTGVNATLTGGPGDDTLIGGSGNDVINGGGGNDTIYGGDGNDVLSGGDGNDVLHGNNGDDVLDGGNGNDYLYGGAGDDTLIVSTGTDVLDGVTDPAIGDTASFINATSGVNANLGPAQQDFTANGLGLVTLLNIQNLTGSNFGDILTGDDNNNTLSGGNGDDVLTGGKGDDILNGGAGTDYANYTGNYAQYTVAVGNTGNGTVTDNTPARDGTDTLSSIEQINFNDGYFTTADQTFHPNFVDVPPVVTTSAGTTAAQEQTLIAVDSGLTVTDVDSPNLVGATVAITGGFQSAEDVLAFTNQNGITGSYNSGTGVLTLSGSASLANYQTALESVTYDDTSDTPNTGNRTVSFTANDGFLNSNIATKTVSVAAVDDAPVVTTSVGTTAAQEQTPIAVDSGLTVTDVDSANLTGATVSITGNFQSAEDTLNFVNQNGITGVYNSGTGVLTLSGSASLANYQTALESVTYDDTSDTPNTGNRTVSFQVNDGTLNSNIGTKTVSVAAVDDAPVVTTTAGTTASQALTPIAVDSGLTVTDIDSPNLAGATVSITGNFQSGEDVLGFTNQNGITGVYNSGTGILTLSGSASQANYQTALESVTFEDNSLTPNLSNRTVSFTVNDGTLNSNIGTKTVSVSAGETFNGGPGPDTHTGTAFDDILNGNGGDDTLTGAGGNDTIDGGPGTDTAVYSTPLTGASAVTIGPDVDAVFSANTISTADDVTVGWNGSAFTVSGPDGNDTVTNVERLQGSSGRVLLVGGGGYATINAALADAQSGDTVLIAPGEYDENVAVNTSNVKIIGLTHNGVGVTIHGTFEDENVANHGMTVGQPVNQFLQNNNYDVSGVGDGITVAADNVTLSNITVEDFDTAVKLAGPSVSGLTLEGMTLQHSVEGFNKPDDTALNGLTIDGSTISDDYIGVYLANDSAATGGPGFGQDATDTTITNTDFQDITVKGIYAETMQGTNLLDGITMNNVGQFGTGLGFGGTLGGNGDGIDLNLKYHTYTGDVTISNFDLTNTGSSTGGGLFPNGHVGGGAIVLEGRDDAPSYNGIPADTSGLNITVEDGTIDGTSTGIRTGEPGKNNVGPAVTVTDVGITNASLAQVNNLTQSQMTFVDADDLGDTYVADPNALGPFAFYGGAGNDYFAGGANDDTLQGGGGDDILDGEGGTNTADYSDATSDGLVVDLNIGASSGGGLGNDSLVNVQNVTGSDYNDTLVGDDNDNVLVGGLGNDILYGHAGTNSLYGGDTASPFDPSGTDVAYYSGLENDPVNPYSVIGTPGFLLSVTGGADGVNDSLFNVERVKFLAPSHVSDANNDGTSDLIYQNNTTGNLKLVLEPEPGSSSDITGIGGNNWRAVGTGQFTPDDLVTARQAGVLLQDTGTGNLEVVTDLTGTPTITPLSIQPGDANWQTLTGDFSAGTAWKAITTGDFNGDAASDILLQNQSNGAVEIMFLNTDSSDGIGSVDSIQSVATPGANWKAIASGDFNGDGKSDILWQNSSTKQIEVSLMSGSSALNTPAAQNATGLTAVGTGDFNGDGYSDVLFKNASGQAVVWFMYGDIHTGTKTVSHPAAGGPWTVSGAADVDGNGFSDIIWNNTAADTSSATLMGGPSSLASTTVLNSNYSLTSPGNTFHLLASTGGG